MSNRIKYLKLKRGVYYFQRRVPKALQNSEPFRGGPKTIEISTGASDQNSALLRLAELNTKFEADLLRAKGLSDGSTDTSSSVSFLNSRDQFSIDSTRVEFLSLIHHANLMAILKDGSSIRLKRDRLGRQYVEDKYSHELADLNFRAEQYRGRYNADFEVPYSLKRVALRLLSEDRTVDLRDAYAKLGLARSKAVEQIVQRLDREEGFIDLLSSLIEVELDVIAIANNVRSNSTTELTSRNSKYLRAIGELDRNEDYLFEKVVERLIMSERTSTEWQSKLRRSVEVLRDFSVPMDIRKIKRSHISKVTRELLKCPANKSQLFPETTYVQAIEQNRTRCSRCLSPNTVKDGFLAPLRRAFTFAMDEEIISTSPIGKIKVKGARRTGRGTHFEDYELHRLFTHSLFVEARKYNGEKIDPGNPEQAHWVWGPVLALFTGARTSELAALRLQDLYLKVKTPYLHVRTSEIRSLKTPASSRRVPVHQTLLNLGLETLARRSESAGYDELFPGWLAPKGKGYADAPSQRHFRRYLIPFATDRTDPKPNFHSFRNTFKSGLINAGVSEAHQNAIIGHEQSGMTAVYGTGIKLEPLAEAVNAFRMDCSMFDGIRMH